MSSPLQRRLAAAVAGLAVLAAGVAPAAAQPPSTTAAPGTTEPAQPPPTPPPSGPEGIALVGPDLAQGSSGAEVALFQWRLLGRGVFLRDPLGEFGTSTRHAVVAFQKYAGLKRTGRIDFWTRIALGATTDRLAPRRPQPGRSLDVDLGRQILMSQVDGRLEWVFDVSTGKRSTPTPRGSFRIQRTIDGLRISRLGRLWRPRYFTGGYAIHGSESVPASPASHGCVRLTNQEIDFIWAAGIAPVGTPLTVG